DQGLFEARNHATGAQDQRGALGTAAGEGLAVDLADEVDVQLIAVLGGTLDGLETGVLLAQDFQHVVDVGVSYFSLQALDGDTVETGQLDLREDFEGGDVLEILALLEHFRLDCRSTGRVQLLLDDGLVEGGLDQVAQGFLARGVLVALTDHVHRHLAGTEARHLGAAGSLLQALGHFGLDALGRHADGHAALESGGAFNRNLHGYSSLHRHKPAFRPQNRKASILVARITEVTCTKRARNGGIYKEGLQGRWCGRRDSNSSFGAAHSWRP